MIQPMIHPPASAVDTRGRHLLAEYHGCPAAALDDVAAVETALNQAAVAAGATVVQSAFHRFRPQGVSGVVILAESHLSVHTWPEAGYAAVDLYTCGAVDAAAAHAHLAVALGATRSDLLWVARGLQGRPGASLAVVDAIEAKDPGAGSGEAGQTPKGAAPCASTPTAPALDRRRRPG